MLVTLEQLEDNLTETLTLVKSYIDSCIRTKLANDESSVYATAVVTPKQGA
jgi:hypothetical protein